MCPATPPTTAPLMHPAAFAGSERAAVDSRAVAISNVFMLVSPPVACKTNTRTSDFVRVPGIGTPASGPEPCPDFDPGSVTSSSKLPLGGLWSTDPELVSQSHQLRDARGLHFSHYLAPMHLNGHFADPELPRDLLVEAAGHHQGEHLALAGSQHCEAAAQLGQPRVAGAAHTVLLECRAHRI